ncbi:hypothetical protein FUT69_05380 [Xylella taiwanensis]|uniref:Transposase n=1 Tax=Xylella taiwanensis TaxID=1444770 RepID=A0ABS8TSG3_9GAMM|nr:hypothetical protein [Xylella taiwanensis]MCD8455701.1 hypothetical protein [Xylella taiwanensis]MCD8458108.1 hypothetical protein [Xylella taiwanensis]MCD8460243.1 hypothetical protein [Xylella taiwanensis]MCD8464745.1 hypothetical protein [Xylella taiwanensis]MCD8467696.1 hypothetical protein [Xylella taiwanensis]
MPGWNTENHLFVADVCAVITFSLLPEQAHDAPECREWLKPFEPLNCLLHVLMLRANSEVLSWRSRYAMRGVMIRKE